MVCPAAGGPRAAKKRSRRAAGSAGCRRPESIPATAALIECAWELGIAQLRRWPTRSSEGGAMTGAAQPTARGGAIFFTLGFLAIAVFFAWQFGQEAVIITSASGDPELREPVAEGVDYAKAAWEAARSKADEAKASFEAAASDAKAACENPGANCPDAPPGWKVWKVTDRSTAAGCRAAAKLLCDNAKATMQAAEGLYNDARRTADELRP